MMRNAWDIDCPKCNVPPGFPCDWSDVGAAWGGIVPSHPVRWREVQQELDRHLIQLDPNPSIEKEATHG